MISAVLVAIAAFAVPAGRRFAGVRPRSFAGRTAGQPALDRHRRGRHRHRAGRDHPGADRLLHRDRPPAGEGHRQGVGDRRGHGHPGRHQRRLRVGGLLGPGHRRRRLRRVPLVGGSILSLFAVALAGSGLLTTVGVIVAMDTFGPISDNAQGIAEMSGDIDEDGRPGPHRPRRGRQHHQGDHQGHRDRDRRTGRDRAVRVVHRTRSSSALRTAGVERVDSTRMLNVSQPKNLVGLLIGAAVVFLFSGLAINAVSRSAMAVVFEVRRQFREFPGHHGRHPAAGVRQGRRHLHPGRAARAAHPGSARDHGADRGRLRPRRGRARRRTWPARSAPAR